MKRGTVGLVKFTLLCSDLDLPQYAGVGLLTELWRITAENCPAGDIGRFSDAEIAVALGWRGHPEQLIEVLVARRWLDANETHRLVVHDWPEHCEPYVHFRLIQGGQQFADGTAPSITGLRGSYYTRAKALLDARGVTQETLRSNDGVITPVLQSRLLVPNANAILDPGSSPTCKLSLERSGGVLRGGACAPLSSSDQVAPFQETLEMPQDALGVSGSMETPSKPRSRRAGERGPVSGDATDSVDAVVAAWNHAAAQNGHGEGFGLRACRVLSTGRRRHLLARLSEPGWVSSWRDALTAAAASSFVAGHNDRGWRGNMDWFLRPDTVARLLDGTFESAATKAGF